MALGLTEDQRALAESLTDWASGAATTDLVRSAEHDGAGAFGDLWAELTKLGVASIAVPEQLGGAGGSFLDLACALEACAAALVPGPLLTTALAATLLCEQTDRPGVRDVLGGIVEGTCTVAVALSPADLAVEDGRVTAHVVLGTVPGHTPPVRLVRPVVRRQRARLRCERRARKVGRPLAPRRVRATGRRTTLGGAFAGRRAGARARGHARRCGGCGRRAMGAAHGCRLRQGARAVREADRVVQAVKHLCAQMLEVSECATAVAWDAAAAYDDGDDQLIFAAAVAGAVALDAAVGNAQDCIQVLGGVGFTWEHDAHLYLRRAMTNRQLLGGSDGWRLALADAALTGARRSAHVDLGAEGDRTRAQVRAQLAEVAALDGHERRVALAEAGLLAPHWPRPFGLGAGPLDQVVIDEEIRAAGVTRPDLAIGAWAAPTILEHGTDDQRDRFVAPTLRGEVTWCQLFSEPGAGSDLASLRTKAERVEGGWRLTGQKVWTSLAQQADWAICLARTNPDVPQHQGISYFLLDMSSAGIDIRPLREMTGEALFNEVFLDGVLVPDDCVVGEVDGGWKLARTTLANERVAMSGSSLGVSLERALQAVSEQAEVGQALRLRLGTAVAEATTLRTLGLRSTLRSLAGQGPGPESSVQKLVGVRQRQDSAELALTILGEGAVLGDAAAQAAWHEALTTRCLSIAGGTTQVLRNVAAERILGLPRG